MSQLIQRIDCYLISKKYKRVTMMVPDEQLDYVAQIITKVNIADNMDDDLVEDDVTEEDNNINESNNEDDIIIDMRAPISTPPTWLWWKMVFTSNYYEII